jgi:hypothetical protein
MSSAIIPKVRPRKKPMLTRRVTSARKFTARGMALQRISIPVILIMQIPIAAFLISCMDGATDSTSVRVM